MKKRDYSNDGITEEELQAELDQMHQEGKYSSPHKRINRKVRNVTFVRKLAIVVVTLTLVLSAYVWTINSVGGGKESLVEIIKDVVKYIKTGGTAQGDGQGAYSVNIGGDSGNGNLELAFDPNFNQGYLTLRGLGYGAVSDIEGGSLLSYVGMNTLMFDKFQNLAENEEMASIYDDYSGSANFDQYYANKFYLRNSGDATTTYYINIHVSRNTNHALQAARFMLVSGDSVNGYDYHIYATPYEALEPTNRNYVEAIAKWHEENNSDQEIAAWNYETTASGPRQYFFADPNKHIGTVTYDINDAWLCENLTFEESSGFYDYYSCTFDDEGNVNGGSYFTLLPGQSVCYTFCVWYEGSDQNHDNSIANGGMEFTINYKAFEIKEEEPENNSGE